MITAAAALACAAPRSELVPAKVSQNGGVELHVKLDLDRALPPGGVVVLVDGVPAHATVIEAPGRLRARLPSLPRAGLVDVEVLFADGTSVTLPHELEVSEPKLEVRARD